MNSFLFVQIRKQPSITICIQLLCSITICNLTSAAFLRQIKKFNSGKAVAFF